MFGDDIALDDLEDITALAIPFPDINAEKIDDSFQEEAQSSPPKPKVIREQVMIGWLLIVKKKIHLGKKNQIHSIHGCISNRGDIPRKR